MTDTAQAMADAKREIDTAVLEIVERLLVARTGIYPAVTLETIDTSTYNKQSRIYSSQFKWLYPTMRRGE